MVTLCFVTSLFLLSPPEDGYEKTAGAIEGLLNKKIYRCHVDVPAITRNAAKKSDAGQRIGEYLRQAGMAVPSAVLAPLTPPTQSNALSIIDESTELIYWRRVVEGEIDVPEQIFVPSGVTIGPKEIARSKQLPPPTEAILSTKDVANASAAQLILKYGEDSPGKQAPHLLIPVEGHFEPVPNTTLREWLQANRLLQPPWFAESPAPAQTVTFLPDAGDVWREILGKKPADAVAYLLSEAGKHQGKIKVFEVDIDQGMVAVVIPALLLIIQVTLYLHVLHLRRLFRRDASTEARLFPWVGLFPDILGRTYYGFSVVVWPLLISVGLLVVNRQACAPVPIALLSGTLPFSVATFILTLRL
jgi:hypothetical protein